MNPLLHKNYSNALIADYVAGKLSASDMHDFEKDIANDPMLAEAVEGFMENKEANVNQLTIAIEHRIAQKHKKATIVFILKTWQAIAAILIVVVGVAILVMYQPKGTTEIVKQPIDTLKTPPNSSIQSIDTAQKQPIITKKRNDKNASDTAIKTNANNMAGNNNSVNNNSFTIKGNAFSGTVTDNAGVPISQVSIATPNQLISTTTDSLGHFSFKSLDTTTTVILKKSGFKDKRIAISASKKALIQLQKQ